LDLSSSYSRSQSIGGQANGNDSAGQFNRTYFTVTPGIAWDFEKNWRLKGSYVYRQQSFQQDNSIQNLDVGTSDSNLLMISLSYSWDGIRQSR
jgi:opacity protein-like surface antigen